MALTTETDYLTAIKAHKRTLLEKEWHAQSLENGFAVMQTTEVQDVLKQVDDADFYECTADGEGSCHCPDCKRYEQESMDDALGTWKAKQPDEDFDEHEECRDSGHLCEDCLGTAIDRAHDMADMER